ncbi:MAG: hypothetical protein HY821_20680 [Acidobacteria bacterium]|nr:hypothetical protein [Acidobacteriota bacterium]
MKTTTLLVVVCLALPLAAAEVDLAKAVVVTARGASKRELKAAAVLVEEVEKRSGIRWKTAQVAPEAGAAVVIGSKSQVDALLKAAVPAAPGAEGYSTGLKSGKVFVAGADERGVLFGVGHLLRNLEMKKGRVTLRDDYQAATAPESKLRGHQLGYRPKTNSYDGWDAAQWDQYIRDLAIFGTNAIELIPPRSDDEKDSPHFPRPQMEMMIEMSRIADEYGLDVWIWYPAMDNDYSDPKTVEFALAEWAAVFERLPRVDAVLVPAGDPGHTPAPILMPFLEKQAANLKKYHPKAQLWLAPQGFDTKSIEFFFAEMAKRPAWLTGITYGPQVRLSLPELRKRLPKEVPIRHYPDITHSRQSQYPVPDWDVAWALTSSREPINPRPVDEAKIFHAQQKYTIGFITYSEGCNDDVNKIVWSGLGWDSQRPVVEWLREFGRYFIGSEMADDFGQGLQNLERNWRGAALTNPDVEITLAQFQAMERRATPQQLLNWRFQQALYRAYYDAYVQRRLKHEMAVEDQAMDTLRRGMATDTVGAMSAAARVLDESGTRVAEDLRVRVFQLAEALYQSIRMQLAVKLYFAQPGRGNTLDTLDTPLNQRAWMKQEFARIGKLDLERERRAALARMANWSDPGPGGFYDDLGNATRQPHLAPGAGMESDPQFFATPVMFFNTNQNGPRSWWDQAMALYEYPLEMNYGQLDPHARYKVRVVYAAGPVRMEAEGTEIHSYVEKPWEVLEFDVPESATKDGKLTVKWNRPPGVGGAGRGCQLAEVWLIKK